MFESSLRNMAYLQDTFNRADAGSWGTRSDGLASWSTIDAGSGYGWSITSNTGRITGNWNGERAAYTPLPKHNDIVITFDFTTSAQWELSGGRAENMYAGVLRGTSGQRNSTAYGINIWGDNSGGHGLEIIDNGTVRAYTSFATANSTLYHVEIDINSSNHMDVYVYTGSKPGTPTLSFTNGGSAYTPTASGSNFGLDYLPNQSSTGTVSFDDFLITNYAPFMPRPAKLPIQAPNRASTY